VRISDYFPVYRKNLNLAVPVIFSQIGQVTVNLVDNIMVGHLGTTELAAASFANNVFHIGMYFGLGLTMGITPLVGQSMRSHDSEKLQSLLKNGVFINAVLTVLLCSLMSSVVFFMNEMGQPDEVVQKAIPYYLIHVISLLPLMMFFTLKQFFEGLGNTKIAMVITIFVNLVNLVFNYLLIYGKLGFPALGLNGAGIASLIARLIMPMIFLWFVLRKTDFKDILVNASKTALDRLIMKRISLIGLSIGSQMVIEVLAFTFGAIMLGWISKESLAGHQVAISLAGLTYLVSFGLASGTTIRVSHAMGDHNKLEVRQSIFASLHLVIAFMTLMGILFVLFRNQLPMIFTTDPAVIQVASGLLVLAALFQVFDGVQVVLLGSLRGMTDVRIPMIMAFFSYIVVSLPLSYFFAFVLNFGYHGVWMGFVFGLGSAAILFSYRLKHQFRKFGY
jgi:multidrug resistance protein, MATE family